MPTHDRMVAAVNAYVAAFEAGSAEAVVAIYAEDGTVEDPVGSGVIKGHEAIRNFYIQSMQTGAKLKLEGDVRTAGNFAAFAFHVLLHYQGEDRHIDVIDTFEFNDQGKVVAMRAYWSPQNMHGF